MTANADIPDPVGKSRQRYELGNNSSHKGTIVPTLTLDEYEYEYEDVKRRAFIAGLRAARESVVSYADETHQHVGINQCWPESGDRCDITAALRVAAARILALIDT